MGWHRATSLFAIAALGCLPARMAPPADAPDGLAADVPADAAPEADVPDDPAAEATDPAQGEAPDPDAPKPGSFLAPCSTGHDCDCGICVTAAGEDVCSRACDGGCPKGWQCRKAAEAGPEVCMPDAWALCRPCSEDQDCTTPWGAANRL
ncbi:MAG: hypothetical protein FJ087_20410, partial [Deltaproteobacteria bacterium]|nr:hypothetical protein [Deltaproteobacteria bacterium]